MFLLVLNIIYFSFFPDITLGMSCAGRKTNDSVVCVCNVSACDDFVTSFPSVGQFNVYVSSQRGMRFYKSSGLLQSLSSNDKCSTTITVDTKTRFQSISGFGGAVTDAAALNWMTLSRCTRERLIQSYFGPKGINYNMIRLPIGATDFSTRFYSYDDFANDTELKYFRLAPEDHNYKIPMIQAAMSVAGEAVRVVSAAWSAPTWMKTTPVWAGLSFLQPQHYQSYANYYVKFLEAYQDHNIDVWAVSPQNEPINGMLPNVPLIDMAWTSYSMGKWISQYLGPTIRKSKSNKTLLLANDDQRINIPVYFTEVLRQWPEAKQYIAGVGVHWYEDSYVEPTVLDVVHEDHPDKFLLMTEACNLPGVILGSWERAEQYAKDIIENLSHHVTGWIDWNLCLNKQGGPNNIQNYVDSPIIVVPERDEFLKQPMYYIMGHFSKFLTRDSVRVASKVEGGDVQHVAVQTKNGTVVVVVLNMKASDQKVKIRVGSNEAVIKSGGKSITTVELRCK